MNARKIIYERKRNMEERKIICEEKKMEERKIICERKRQMEERQKIIKQNEGQNDDCDEGKKAKNKTKMTDGKIRSEMEVKYQETGNT